MGPGTNQPATAFHRSQMSHTSEQPAVASANGAGWEQRLYTGLRMASVPGEVRAALANALGELGVEAEFFLLLINNFPGGGAPSRVRGESFLGRLEAAARRLVRTADTLEVATQGYLTALEADDPGIRNAAAEADPWWPPAPDFEITGESIELRLRRCGFAYRHVVAAYLAANIEAIATHLSLVLHALSTLPPAGVLPTSSLYQGLYELYSAFQGYLIPQHIVHADTQTPGLLTGIARLRALDAQEDTSLQSDLAWAETQLAATQTFLHTQHISAAQRQWALAAAQEWQETINLLKTVREPAR